MADKDISVVFYHCNFLADKWRQLVDTAQLAAMFAALTAELAPLGYRLQRLDDAAVSMDINGYGDLLNSVRLRAPQLGIGNMCLGHVIGASRNLNLAEDIRRGVNRVAFAPETIEPEGSDKVVCHNCGCGC
jgi:hypothetical protein